MEMKWKRGEYAILEKVNEVINARMVKGVTAYFHGWLLGLHKTQGGIWVLTDVNTGCQIRHRDIINYEDTQKRMKEFIELYEQDIYNTLERVYNNKKMITELEQLKDEKLNELENN